MILLVLMMSPNMVCFGPITSSNHLSMARGHRLTATSGLPITTKMTLIVAARTIFIWSTSRANINALLTYAGRKINLISSIIHNTIIDGTRKCRSEFGGWINLFPLQHINECLVPYDQIRPVSKNFG